MNERLRPPSAGVCLIMASKKRSSARISEKEKPSADDADDADDTKHAEVKETTKAKRAKLAAPFGSGRGGVFGYAQESDGPSPAFGGSPFTFGSGAGAGAGLGPPEAVAALHTFGQAPVKKALHVRRCCSKKQG